MIFRPDRSRRGEGRFLAAKMLLFALGGVAGVMGIAREIGWLIYGAIALLAIGLVLRLLERGRD
jgi:hypothetical protein